MRRALDVIRRDVRAHGLWRPGARVLLACSGGLDSRVALELLARLQPSLGHMLAVGHVDHGLRPDSGAAAELVAQAAGELAMPYAIRHLHMHPGAGLEARARVQRYRALESMRRELGCDVVATAHHAGDQAETLLLRAVRGSNLEGMAGIRRQRDEAVVRPLLGLDRPWLERCAVALDLRHAEDPSNADVAFGRNHLRHRVMPMLDAALPGAARGLARTAAHLAEHAGVLDGWIARALADALWLEPCDAPRVAVLGPTALPAERPLRASLLHYLCRRLSVAAPSQRATDQFCAFADSPTRTSCDLKGLHVGFTPGGWRFEAVGVAPDPGAD